MHSVKAFGALSLFLGAREVLFLTEAPSDICLKLTIFRYPWVIYFATIKIRKRYYSLTAGIMSFFLT